MDKCPIPGFWKQTICLAIGDCQDKVDRVMDSERWVVISKKEETFQDIWAGWMYFSYKIHGRITKPTYTSVVC